MTDGEGLTPAKWQGRHQTRLTPEFDLAELITWLNAAQLRYQDDGPVTARLEGTGINIYQAGTYRAAVDLDSDRPCISHWADDDA